MAGVASFLYRSVFKRSSTLLLSAVVGGVILERGLDIIAEEIFHNINRGVRNTSCFIKLVESISDVIVSVPLLYFSYYGMTSGINT